MKKLLFSTLVPLSLAFVAIALSNFSGSKSMAAPSSLINTTATISVSPSGTVTVGTPVTVTGTVHAKSGSTDLGPVPDGAGTIGFYFHAPGATPGSFTLFASCLPSGGTGSCNAVFNTTSYAPTYPQTFQLLQFKVVYTGNSTYKGSSTPPVHIRVIAGACTGGLSITSSLASGNGHPNPGDSGPWQFNIHLQNCTGVPLSGVKVQGGSNGWAPVQTPYAPLNIVISGGSYVVKGNNKNQVITWTVYIPNGGTADLTATVNGTIPASALCASDPVSVDPYDIACAYEPSCISVVRWLSGPWSAVFNDGSGPQKSDYTNRVFIVTTCP
jgi:hypothetical protein